MKVTFTFEFSDLLEHIEKLLSMNGVKLLGDSHGGKQIHLDPKKKQIVAHCEAAPIPSTCPFCGKGVEQELPTSKDAQSPQTNIDVHDNDEAEAAQANTVEENVPMSLSALRAQSNALASRKGPIKVQRGAEAHAALAKPVLMDGESEDAPGEGDF
jgi:hypothetical protein